MRVKVQPAKRANGQYQVCCHPLGFHWTLLVVVAGGRGACVEEKTFEFCRNWLYVPARKPKVIGSGILAQQFSQAIREQRKSVKGATLSSHSPRGSHRTPCGRGACVASPRRRSTRSDAAPSNSSSRQSTRRCRTRFECRTTRASKMINVGFK